MVVICGACGKEIEVDGELSVGQCVLCPVCGEQTQFDKPTRIEIPVCAIRRVESTDAQEDVAATEDIVPKEKPKLRVIRDRNQGNESVNPIDKRKIHLAEERLKMYEELKHKAWRRKLLTNLFSVIVLLALPISGWFIYSEWVMHTKRLERDAELKEAEERLRSAREERERREQYEKEKLAREARIAEENAARQHAMELEQEERSKLELQRKVMTEQYRIFSSALCENEFDLFNKNVTQDLEKVEGELCYCLPSKQSEIPFYWVTYSTKGVETITEIRPDGITANIDCALFESMIRNQDYIVARGGKVYFHSRKKNKRMGEIPKDKPMDPAEAFFGDMSDTLEMLKPTYDELTFDIIFVPVGSAKEIKCENVEFGSKYSPANVREAVETAFPPKKSFGKDPPKIKKFKRTVKFWNGSSIKRGLDDITYVPRTYQYVPRTYHCKPIWHNFPHDSADKKIHVIWRTGTRSDNNYGLSRDGLSYSRWQSLYDQAKREEAAEAAYYEKENRRHADMENNRLTSENAAWFSKIDRIISEGKLYYRIKKAKRKD